MEGSPRNTLHVLSFKPDGFAIEDINSINWVHKDPFARNLVSAFASRCTITLIIVGEHATKAEFVSRVAIIRVHQDVRAIAIGILNGRVGDVAQNTLASFLCILS